MAVSRELSATSNRSQENGNESRNNFTEADYIEFSGVKVLNNFQVF